MHALCDGAEARLDAGPLPEALAWLSDHEVVIGDLSGWIGEPMAALRVWDVERDAIVREFDCHGVKSLCCAGDRSQLVTLSVGGVELWDAGTGARTALLLPTSAQATTIALDARGEVLAYADRQHRIRITELDAQPRFRELAQFGAFVRWLEFVADEPLLLAAVDGRGVIGVDLHSGDIRFEFETAAERVIASPNGRTAVVLPRQSSHETVLLDLRSARQIARRATLALNAAFSPDGTELFTVGGWSRGRVVVFDPSTLEERHRFHGHERGGRGIAVSPDGRRFATGTHDQTVRVWQRQPRRFAGWEPCGVDARTMSATPDRTMLGTTAIDGTWKIWRTADLAVVASGNAGEPLPASAMSERRFYAVGQRLLVRDIDAAAGVLEPLPGAPPSNEWPGPRSTPTRLLVDTRDRWLACLHLTHLLVWQLPVTAPPWRYEPPGYAQAIAYDPTTDRLALGCSDGIVRFFDPRTGAPDGELRGLGPTSWLDVDKGAVGELPIFGLTFFGNQIASASADGRIRILDRTRGGPPRILRGHEVICHTVAFSSDGTRIVSTGGDSHVRIWDAASGTDLLSLKERQQVTLDAIFSPDSRRIVTLYQNWGEPSFVHWWDAP